MSFYMLCSRSQSTCKGFSTKVFQRASVDCLFADWQYCLIVFIAWFSFLFWFNFCFFVPSSKYIFIRMHKFYCGLPSLVLAGDSFGAVVGVLSWTRWKWIRGVFLEWTGKETDCKQLKLLLQLTRHFERKIKLPWLQMGCARDYELQ